MTESSSGQPEPHVPPIEAGGGPASAGAPEQPAAASHETPAAAYGSPQASYGPYSTPSSYSYPPPYYTQPLPPVSGYPPAPPYGTGTGPAKTRSGRTVLLAAVTAALVGGLVGAGTVAVADDNGTNRSAAGLAVISGSPAPALKIDGSVTAAAKKIEPSVVTINVSGSQESGTGSGVIIRSDGYILTNNHVVAVGANGGSISVVTNDGQQASAKVVGTDASDDLAVVKVVGLNNLTAATFGKSGNLVVGQTVVAVGAPLGLSDTVTSGIVSNTARPVTTGDSQSSEAVFNAVQTDAAINPGNSGGPLVDLNGNVVGINAAIATANSGGLNIPGQQQQSGSIGIGFAIPSDEASRIASELITNGKATHAVIGVSVAGAQNQQSSLTGATISAVTSNGAAAAAGLKAGDVVTALGGQRIADATALVAAVRSHAPGETVALTYLRGGKSTTVHVKLGSATN
jgi:putative serine protease PepD